MYAGLRVITPPAIEPVTVDLARLHCRIDQDNDDDLLAMFIVSARMLAETYLNRSLLQQQLQYSITWAPPPTATPLVPQSLIVFPLNWPPLVKRPIELPRAPLASVEQIMWGALGDLQLADPDTDYTLNLAVEPGYVAVSPQLLPQIPQQSMVIDYTAGGYSADDPTQIPMPIVHAVLVMVARMYEQRGDVDADMPPTAAKRLMDAYRLWTFSG